MTSVDSLHRHGAMANIAQRLGHPEITIVGAEHYVVPGPSYVAGESRYPDLLVAFGVDPVLYAENNGYIISEQGKPPDFVLEVASRSSGREDTGPKRRDYAGLLIPEYWRFDETGRYHGAKLAGDRLVNGGYAPIDIEELPDGSLQGYSAVLNLNLRWEPSGLPPLTATPARGLERGQLVFCDPATGRRIATLEDERARADHAEAQLDAEREARNAAEAELATERARVRELEARLGQQGG